MNEEKIENPNNITRNTSFFTLALVMQKIISLTYFTLIARALGPEDLGKYYFAISFTSIFSIFMDLGLANVLTREVARSKEKAGELLGSIIALKIPLAAASVILTAIFINLLGYPEITKALVYISVISMVLDSFSPVFFAVSRGFHNLSFESVSSVIFQLIVMVFGLSALYLGAGLKWLMTALALASVFQIIYAVVMVRRKWGIAIRPIFNYPLLKNIIRLSLPFGAFVIFQRTYVYLDSVLLSLLAGDRHVGLYQIAFKMVYALQFIPMAFTASLYPAFSSYWRSDRARLAASFERALNYLMIVSLPISFGVAAMADKIILLFRSGYNEAVLPIQIAIFSLFFIFITFPLGSLLNACDRQKINTLSIFLALALSIGLNLILIPLFQAAGASVTVLLTSAFMFFFCLSAVRKIIIWRTKETIKTFLKTILAAILMSLAVFYLKNEINPFLTMAAGAVIYSGLILFLGAIKKEEVLSVFDSIIKKPL